MLVLSRKAAESIVIDRDIRITILKIRRHCVSLGIEAPDGFRVYRNELLEEPRPGTDGAIPEKWQQPLGLDGSAPESPVEPPDGPQPGADHLWDDQAPAP